MYSFEDLKGKKVRVTGDNVLLTEFLPSDDIWLKVGIEGFLTGRAGVYVDSRNNNTLLPALEVRVDASTTFTGRTFIPMNRLQLLLSD